MIHAIRYFFWCWREYGLRNAIKGWHYNRQLMDAGYCTRCERKLYALSVQSCWYCMENCLCFDCWDTHGHCGHERAEHFERHPEAYKRIPSIYDDTFTVRVGWHEYEDILALAYVVGKDELVGGGSPAPRKRTITQTKRPFLRGRRSWCNMPAPSFE
jgi:hypothetical protein